MDSKNSQRLSDKENIPKTKRKEKARKELWDSLCAIYENEKGEEINTGPKQMKIRDNIPQDLCSDLPQKPKNDVKFSKKTKPRHLKKAPVNENGDHNHNEERKCKHTKRINAAEPSRSLEEKDKNVPSVIVLHKYKKGIFNTQTDPPLEENNLSQKPTHRPDKNQKKSKVEPASNSQKNILSDKQSSCDNLKTSSIVDMEDKSSMDYRQHLNDKSRKKLEKLVYKTLVTSVESKLRKKRKKLDRQRVLKEVVSSLNKDKDIYDKIKNLPIKIDENQLIFMHPTHIAKALEQFKKKNIKFKERVQNDSSVCNELNKSISKNISKKVSSDTSITEWGVGNSASSKRLQLLSSIKKLRKSIPVVLEEKSNITLSKVSKNKELKKRSRKLISAEDKKIFHKLTNTGDNSKDSEKITLENGIFPVTKYHSSVIRQNVSFGDNQIDSNPQHDRLSQTFRGSSRHKKKLHNKSSNLKKLSIKEQKLKHINQSDLEKLKKLVKISNDSENQLKPSFSEDEKNLTFQLLKPDADSNNHGRLRKNVYSVSDRRTLISSKENVAPLLQNDRLYVTKRMLFFTNKESSSTSKESLNIAIRRDTEISNNGSSNNILNVVIKQKKNSVTSTKSMNSPKLSVENKCSKHCDTKSLEKMFVENYLEKIFKDKDMSKSKELKEVECQTEENSHGADYKKDAGDQASTQSFELASNDIQKDFCNFLIYHFRNQNPVIRKMNTEGDSCGESTLKHKQTFPTGMDKSHGESQFCEPLPNYVNRNMKSLNLQNQCNNRLLHDDGHTAYPTYFTSNKYYSKNKPFYRVVESDEYEVEKTKCDKIPHINKVSHLGIKDKQNKISNLRKKTNSTIRLIDNQKEKIESENILGKLKNLGLTDKHSFIKVLNSNHKLENPNNSKVDTDGLLQFKISKSLWEQNDTFKENIKDDSSKVVSRNQKGNFGKKNKFFTGKNENGKVEIQRHGFFSSNENCTLENTNLNINESCNFSTNNIYYPLKSNTCYMLPKGDNYKSSKHDFINILSANEGIQGNRYKKSKVPQVYEETKMSSYSVMTKFMVSEVGVQTDSCSFLPLAPNTNVSCSTGNKNSKSSLKNGQKIAETIFSWEKSGTSNKNIFDKFIHIDNKDNLPQEKGSFIHIIKKTHSDKKCNMSSIKNEKDVKVPVNYFEREKTKQDNFIKNFDEEKQIVHKINAVYDFLQYLDKMLKNGSFFKLDSNITKYNHTIGHFNSTLRCLCNNCIEILNKFGIQESVDQNKNLKMKKSFENLISKSGNPNSVLAQIVGRAKNISPHSENGFYLPKKPTNDLPKNPRNNLPENRNTRNVQPNELESSKLLTGNLISERCERNPFFVIVSPDKKSQQPNCNFKSKHSHKENGAKTNLGFKGCPDEVFFNHSFNEHIEGPMNKLLNSQNTSKSDNSYKKNFTKIDRKKSFYKQLPKKQTKSHDNLEKLQSQASLKIPSKPIGSSSVDCQHNLMHNLNETAKISFFKSSKRPVGSHKYHNLLFKTDSTESTPFCCKKKSHQYILDKPSSSSKEYLRCECCNCLLSVDKGKLNVNNIETCKIRGSIKKESSCLELNKPEISLTKIDNTQKKTGNKLPDQCSSIVKEKNHFENEIRKESICQGDNALGKQNNTILTYQIYEEDNSNLLDISKKIGNQGNEQRGSRTNIDQKHNIKENSSKTSCGNKKNIQMRTSTVSSLQLPLCQVASCKSTITMKRDPKDSASKVTHSSNSFEYLRGTITTHDGIQDENQSKGKEYDSDGWVPLNEITEIENNKICFGMDINDITVRHVEYVQKFPENSSQSKTQ